MDGPYFHPPCNTPGCEWLSSPASPEVGLGVAAVVLQEWDHEGAADRRQEVGGPGRIGRVAAAAAINDTGQAD